jgi:hypothetical protein
LDGVAQSTLVAPRQIKSPLAAVIDMDGELIFHEYSVQELALHPEAQPPTTRTLILFAEPLTAWKDGTTLEVVDQVTPLSVE